VFEPWVAEIVVPVGYVQWGQDTSVKCHPFKHSEFEDDALCLKNDQQRCIVQACALKMRENNKRTLAIIGQNSRSCILLEFSETMSIRYVVKDNICLGLTLINLADSKTLQIITSKEILEMEQVDRNGQTLQATPHVQSSSASSE
jgi:hypothetical protein